MKIGFRDTDKPVKTLILDGQEYKFSDLLMSNEKPVWKVGLASGGFLFLDFNKEIGQCLICEFSSEAQELLA